MVITMAARRSWYIRTWIELRIALRLVRRLKVEWQHDRASFKVLLMQPECRVIRSFSVSIVLSVISVIALIIAVKGFGASKTYSNMGVSFVMWWVGLGCSTWFVFPDRRTDMWNFDVDEMFGGSPRMVVKTAVFVIASQGSYILLVGWVGMPFLLVKLMQWPVFGPLSYLVNTYWVYPKVRGKLNISNIVKRLKKA